MTAVRSDHGCILALQRYTHATTSTALGKRMGISRLVCAIATDTPRSLPHVVALEEAMSLQTAFVLGQFLGMTELVEKALVTPEQFIKRCIEIAKEYEGSKP